MTGEVWLFFQKIDFAFVAFEYDLQCLAPIQWQLLMGCMTKDGGSRYQSSVCGGL